MTFSVHDRRNHHRNPSLKRAALLTALALIGGMLGANAATAKPPGTELPRHELLQGAKEPFQRGLIAAQQQDWKLAIRYLTDAEKADPDAPEILFNLGLASSKLPGYELRSMAWFQAYLLAAPDAANAGAVRKQLLESEIAFEAKIDRVLEHLESVAAVIQTNRMAFLGSVPSGIVPAIATAYNYLGDPTDAARLLDKYGVHESDPKYGAHWQYVDSVASTGRFDDATKLDFDQLDFLYEQGELERARRSIQSNDNGHLYYSTWDKLACAANEARNHDIQQFAIEKAIAAAKASEMGNYNEEVEELLISVGAPDEARKFALAAKSPLSLYLENQISGATPLMACNRYFWWGKNRRKYLVDFALNGLVLDSKSKLDDTQLEDFLKQEGALMTGGQSDAMQEYNAVTGPLEFTSDEIADLAKAYRIIRGPKID